MRRDWTARDILEEADRRCGGIDLLNELAVASSEAFDDALQSRWALWHFPMGALTVGEIADFFTEHYAAPQVRWLNADSPAAYVAISTHEIALAFHRQFQIEWVPFADARACGLVPGHGT